jgi:hypothetical protein
MGASTGMIITKFGLKYPYKEKLILTREGETQGGSCFDRTVEVDIEAQVPATSPFNEKAGTHLVLANTVPTHHTDVVGRTHIGHIERDAVQEDWQTMKVPATIYPLVTTT